MDDSQSVFATVVSDQTSSKYGEPHSLIIRVRSYKTEVFVVWNEYIQSHSSRYGEEVMMVTSRVGKGRAENAVWNLSEDSQASFMPEPVVPFLRRLASETSLALQTSIDGRTVHAVFDTSGMKDALQPLAKAGGWSF